MTRRVIRSENRRGWILLADLTAIVSLIRIIDSWEGLIFPAAIVLAAHIPLLIAAQIHRGHRIAAISAPLGVLLLAGIGLSREQARHPWVEVLPTVARGIMRQLVHAEAPLSISAERRGVLIMLALILALLTYLLSIVHAPRWILATPSAVVFLFTAVTGSAAYRWQVTLAYAIALLLGMRFQRRTTPISRRAELPLGGAAIAIAAVGCGIAAMIPAAWSPPVMDWRASNPFELPDSIELNSLDDVENWLRLPNTEMFIVKADRGEYWRAHALDIYDGSTWQLNSKTAKGNLNARSKSSGTPLEQEITIKAFVGQELPAAWLAGPVEGLSEGFPEVYQIRETQSVLVDRPTQPGDRYRIVSRPGDHPEVAAPSTTDSDIDSAFAEALLARVSGVMDPADPVETQLQDLQTWFRGTNFSYDLEEPFDSTETGTLTFLSLEGRVGYCQHFATAFALIARANGIPARVAIGFREGTPVQSDEETPRFSVTTSMAHAWPEVYLKDRGWVAFEPTPGTAEDPIRNPSVQDVPSPVVPPSSEVALPENTSSTTTTSAQSNSSLLPSSGVSNTSTAAPASTTPSSDHSDPPWRWLLLLLPLIGGITIALIRRRPRPDRTLTPSEALPHMWQRLRTAARKHGWNDVATATVLEEASSMHAVLPAVHRETASSLATTLSELKFAPAPPSSERCEAVITSSELMLQVLEAAPPEQHHTQGRQRRRRSR